MYDSSIVPFLLVSVDEPIFTTTKSSNCSRIAIVVLVPVLRWLLCRLLLDYVFGVCLKRKRKAKNAYLVALRATRLEQGLLDAVETDKIRVGFTEDCLLRSLETGASFTFRSTKTNNVVVRTGVDILATLTDYGQVNPEEVAIPLKVRQGATPTDEPIDVMDVIGTDSPLAGAVGE